MTATPKAKIEIVAPSIKVAVFGPRPAAYNDGDRSWVQASLNRTLMRLGSRHGTIRAMVSLVSGIGPLWFRSAASFDSIIEVWLVHTDMTAAWPEARRKEVVELTTRADDVVIPFRSGKFEPSMIVQNDLLMMKEAEVMVRVYGTRAGREASEFASEHFGGAVCMIDYRERTINWT